MLMRLKNKKGQSIVEFALLVPLLLLILIAVIEFGILFNAYLVLNTAARDGVRMASVGGTDTQVTTQVQNDAVGIDLAALTITISPSSGSRSRGDDVTVTLNYQHTVITPMLNVIIGNQIPLQVAVTMRTE